MDKYINYIVNVSKYKAIALKNLHKDLYDCITDFSSKNKILLFNKRAIVENEETNIKMENLDEDFNFILFSTTPMETAKELASEIFKKYSKFVVINTFLRGSENIISIDNNRVVYVYKYFSQNIENNPLIRTFNGKKIKFIDHLSALLFISRNLYHPDLFLDICKNKENKLFNEFILILKKMAHNYDLHKKLDSIEIVEGGRNNKELDSIKSFINKEIKDKHKENIVYADNYLPDKIIAINSFDIIKDLKKKLEKKFKQHFRYTISDMFIFNDFRLKKITLMRGLDKLLIIYNNLEYEPIPVFKNKDKLVAHPIVRIRYELFNLSSLINFVKMDAGVVDKIAKKTISNCVELLMEAIQSVKENNTFTYAGEWKDDRIEKFKMGSSAWRPNIS